MEGASELDIARQQTELLDSLRAQRPFVSDEESIQTLIDEYVEASNYHQKAIALRDQYGWTKLRRIRGDGDCFYRACIFNLLAMVILRKDTKLARKVVDTIETEILPIVDSQGGDKEIYNDFYEPLKEALSNPPDSLDQVEALFNEENGAQSTAMVVFLRIVTGAFLKHNKDDYEPFLDEGIDIVQFCSFQVEPLGKEADHIQITALTRALHIPLTIIYLDQSGEAGSSSLSLHHFESGDESSETALLYRPGHYDCAYKQ